MPKREREQVTDNQQISAKSKPIRAMIAMKQQEQNAEQVTRMLPQPFSRAMSNHVREHPDERTSIQIRQTRRNPERVKPKLDSRVRGNQQRAGNNALEDSKTLQKLFNQRSTSSNSARFMLSTRYVCFWRSVTTICHHCDLEQVLL